VDRNRLRALLAPFASGEFPELEALRSLIRRGGELLRSEVVCEVDFRGERLPVYCLELGATDREAPAVGIFGGVHGVERIGSHVAIAFLQTLVERLHWDDTFGQLLEKVRLVFMPLVNPGGMRQNTRCNPAGVDLMRNAPVDAETGAPFLLRGHRLSSRLPWYRGPAKAPMQPEAQALCRVVEERILPHSFALTVDCHSGFGAHDRIWFPYAYTRKPIDCLADVYALRSMFRATHPYHSIYVIEPQSRQYMAHGDLWDYLYDSSRQRRERTFIPLTLEMGSWSWVQKNPSQMFKFLGMFNPIKPHRHHRALRRHLILLDFFLRAAISYPRWKPPESVRQAYYDSAVEYWYREREEEAVAG
jgi:hypothetical protein